MIPKSLGTIAAHIGIDDSGVDRGVRTALSKLEGMQKKISQSGWGMIKIGLVIAAPLTLATKTFAAFDDAMRATQAVTQASVEEFKLLTEQAKFLGRTTSYTARQVAEADVVLGRAGQNVGAAIEPILNLARATGTDLSMAALYASSTLNAFELEADQMTRVTDVLVAGANNAAQTLEELGQSMVYAAPIAKDFGLTLEQTTKYISAMADVGIRGSMAGTSLRMAMIQLSKSDVGTKIKNTLGVDVIDQATSNTKDLMVILNEMTAAMDDMSMGIAKRRALFADIVGARAVSGVLKLATRDIDKLSVAIDNSGGVAQKTAKDMDAGLGGSLRILWSAVEGLTIAMGEGLDKSLQGVAELITTKILGPLTKFIERNKWLIITIGSIAVALITWGTALVTLSTIIKMVTVTMKYYQAVMIATKTTAFALAATFSILGIALMGIAVVASLVSQEFKKMEEINREVSKAIIKSGDEKRAKDLLMMKRLQQLAEQDKLNNEQTKEATNLITTLNKKYTNLGISINGVTGKIEGLTKGQERFNNAMRAAAITEIQTELKKVTSDTEKYNAEMVRLSGFWPNIWVGSAGKSKEIKEIEEFRDKSLSRQLVLQTRLNALKMDTGLSKKEQEDLQTRIDRETNAAAEASETVMAWEQKIQDLKLNNIEDESKRALAEIDLRYERELEKAKINKEITDLITKAKEVEVAQAVREAQKLKDDLAKDELAKVQTLEQRIDMIKARGIKDEHAKRIAEITARYKYELEEAKGNIELIKKLEEARQLELKQVADDEKAATEKNILLPKAVEKGTAAAFSAVLQQENDPAKDTAKNTKKIAQLMEEEKRRKTKTVPIWQPPVLNLGL